jgi:hypothetical protein
MAALTVTTIIGFATLLVSIWTSNRQLSSQVNGRIDGLRRDISGLSDRVARIEGHLGLAADA